MFIKVNLTRVIALASILTLAACGGGGGSSGGTVGGTPNNSGGTGTTPTDTGGTSGGGSTTPGGTDIGISGSGSPVAYGTIDAFGSIWVNGVEFNTDNAQILIDGEESLESDLSAGMVVTVLGTINEDGVTGVAEVVIYDNEVKGQITALAVDAGDEFMTITVLGVEIIVERVATVFEHVTFDTLAIGDYVEISGFPQGVTDQLRATHLEKQVEEYVEGESGVEVEGVLSNLTATTFDLRGYAVDYSAADLSEVPNGELVDGQRVEVHGTVSGTTIMASRVEVEDSLSDQLESDDEFEIQGAISGYVSNAEFQVNGVLVDASSAVLTPSNLVLADDVIVEVEGVWDGTKLVATEVESRRGTIKLEARVGTIDLELGELTLDFGVGSITVQLDSRTQFDEDDDDDERESSSSIVAGDFVEVEAYLDGAVVVATHIERDDADDDKIRAPIEAVNPESEITVLGLTYSVAGAQFVDALGQSVTATEFFAAVSVGDQVTLKDYALADGLADMVSLRSDGYSEHDDDDDDESDDSDSSDDLDFNDLD